MKAGGLSIHCPDCSEETSIKYAGVQAADGKQNQATILKFSSEKDKENILLSGKTILDCTKENLVLLENI